MATSADTTNGLASEVAASLSITENDLMDLIKIQGDLVRKLKADKAPKEDVSLVETKFFFSFFLTRNFLSTQIDKAVAKLISLKKEHADRLAANGDEETIGGEKSLKTPRVKLFFFILFRLNNQ